ncbi:MAG: hypothetical protein NT113_02705 [Hyphomicrobiales bacterium]|nr:hypothetical protein [Hyphomicrobiales bacterium]
MDDEVTLLIYVFRWLTETLPIEQQSPTYRRRQLDRQHMLETFRASGFGG